MEEKTLLVSNYITAWIHTSSQLETKIVISLMGYIQNKIYNELIFKLELLIANVLIIGIFFESFTVNLVQ